MERRDFLTMLSSLDISCKKLFGFSNTFKESEIDENVIKSPLFEAIFTKDTARIKENFNVQYTENFKKELLDKDIKLITFEDPSYPDSLKRIEDPPFFLFCKGDISLLNDKGIAIIGSRMPTAYGKVITERFSKELAEGGLVIISGLAYGVDSIAHRQALDCGAKTIAVLGGGFDKIYPAEHTDLAREIAQTGLLISEYSPSFFATKYSFPQRNRIVAGLSVAVLITEAGMKSGTMITKDFAIDNGIEVFAIPGNITSKNSEGTNKIISSMNGRCALSPSDIFYELGISQKKEKKVAQLALDDNLILEILQDGEKTVDFLCEKTKLNINKLNSLLVNLEIKGLICRTASGSYVLA